MATATATATRASGTELELYALTVAQFEATIDAGIFPEGARVELIGGLLVDKMTKNDPHNVAVAQLANDLRRLLPEGWYLLEEKSIVLGRYDRPEPDIVVVRGHLRDFRRAPRSKDLALVIEVADTSQAKDHGPKLRRYAAVRIPAYWIVNLARGQVEVFTNPKGRGQTAAYLDVETYDRNAEVPLLIDGHDLGRINVWHLLT